MTATAGYRVSIGKGMLAASIRHAGFAAALLALLAAGCGDPPSAPGGHAGVLPADPEARAVHCYLVLTLTIDQLAEFDGAGAKGGFRGRRGSEELLRARRRIAAQLDEEMLGSLRRDPLPKMEAVLLEFDADGDGQLSTAAEVEEFNRHVAACTRPWRSE